MVEKEKQPQILEKWSKEPRHQLFFSFWRDPKSPTFSNVKQSAIRAGFTESYADNILSLMPEWLSDAIGHTNPLLLKAEQNLAEALEFPTHTQAMGMFGPLYEKHEKTVKLKNGKKKKVKVNGAPIMTFNQGLIQKKIDVSMFIAETVGKKKYSKKGNDGAPVVNINLFANDQRTRVATRIVRGRSTSDTDGERASD